MYSPKQVNEFIRNYNSFRVTYNIITSKDLYPDGTQKSESLKHHLRKALRIPVNFTPFIPGFQKQLEEVVERGFLKLKKDAFPG